jgi:hypothetical protein
MTPRKMAIGTSARFTNAASEGSIRWTPAQKIQIARNELVVNSPSQNHPCFESGKIVLSPLNGSQATVNTIVAVVKIRADINSGDIDSRFHFPITVARAAPSEDTTARV